MQDYTTVFKVLCMTPLSPTACSHASVKAQAAGAFPLIYLICILIAREFSVWGKGACIPGGDGKKEKVLDDEQCTVTPVGFLPS